MGQEFVRNLEPGLPPREDGVAELQRVPVDDDRGQQVEPGDPVVLPLPGSVPQFAALVEVRVPTTFVRDSAGRVVELDARTGAPD